MNSLKTPHLSILFYLKRIIGLLLLLSIAAVFLFSGISKLYSFEQLMWNIMDAGVTNMIFAGVVARLFIGFELLLGAFLILHLILRSFTYPAIICLLIFFSIYLFILISKQGDSGNCGCFGEVYAMKPSAGILKNIIMLCVVAFLWIIYPVKSYKHSEWIAVFVGIIAILIPFIFFPLSRSSEPKTVHEAINLNSLYEDQNNAPEIDLRKGKHVIAFMSLSCKHCKKAGFLLHIIYKQHPEIPIYMVLNGSPEYEKDFFKETKAKNIPHLIYNDTEEFIKMLDGGVPSIYWINNSVIERKSNYFQLDPKTIKNWVQTID